MFSPTLRFTCPQHAVPLVAIVAAVGLLTWYLAPGESGPAPEVRAAADDVAPGENRVTHGPLLGRPSSTGIGVWARTARPGPFRVHYGLTADRLDQVVESAPTRAAHDLAGWVAIEGLRPETTYFYRVEAGAADAALAERRGWFRTWPTGDTYRHDEFNPRGLFNFAFEFGCCNSQNASEGGAGPEMPAYKTMLDRLAGEILFSIQDGDWLYESSREYGVEAWRAQIGAAPHETPPVVEVAPSIVGVWQNYKQYLEDSQALAAYHRHVPVYFMFDDHELLNDIWGAEQPGLVDRRAVFRDPGVQAWYDYLGWSNPVGFEQPIQFGHAELTEGSDVLTDPRADFTRLDMQEAGSLHVHWGTPTAGINDNALDAEPPAEPNAGVYAIREVLDAQRLRIEPAARATSRAAAYSIGRRNYFRFRVANCEFFVLDCRSHRHLHDTREPSKPGLSMLGQQQREWLLAGARASDADFIFVVSSVNFMIPHVGGGKIRTTANKDDAWTVFLDEREQLIRAFDALGKPVFVLTGDLHNSFAIKITDRVWEFASAPHNSVNHWSSDEGDRPATGPFVYGPRPADIRWSTHFRPDIPREKLAVVTYCVVQLNNVYDNRIEPDRPRWIAYERPQAVFQYYDGRTGKLRYAEAVPAVR